MINNKNIVYNKRSPSSQKILEKYQKHRKPGDAYKLLRDKDEYNLGPAAYKPKKKIIRYVKENNKNNFFVNDLNEDQAEIESARERIFAIHEK